MAEAILPGPQNREIYAYFLYIYALIYEEKHDHMQQRHSQQPVYSTCIFLKWYHCSFVLSHLHLTSGVCFVTYFKHHPVVLANMATVCHGGMEVGSTLHTPTRTRDPIKCK
jgi:hypothetical protein